MGLFYPTTFGIVGQKMTSLQYRSQGDSEDPHDEHYLLATQSKQDPVTHRYRICAHFTHWIKSDSFEGSCVVLVNFHHPCIFFTSPPNQLQTGRLFPDQVEVWMGRWAAREGLGSCPTCPEAVGVVVSLEGQRGRWTLGLPRGNAWWEQEERRKSPCLLTSPGRLPSWASLRAKHWAWIRPSCIASTAVVRKDRGWSEEVAQLVGRHGVKRQ